MRLKTLVAVAVAAAFAVPLLTQAQSDKPSSGTSGSSASGSSTDVPAKCAALTGADHEKCLLEARSGGSGASGFGLTSPSTSGAQPPATRAAAAAGRAEETVARSLPAKTAPLRRGFRFHV